MPHKRKRGRQEPQEYDLPPSSQADSSRAAKIKHDESAVEGDSIRPSKRTKKGQPSDLPRAFRRVLALERKWKKTKQQDGKPGAVGAEQPLGAATTVPKINPGERFSEFSSRVDAELPISGLAKKLSRTTKESLGLRDFKTRKEKKMHRLYDLWREEDRKIKEKREEAEELAAEREIDRELFGADSEFGKADSSSKVRIGQRRLPSGRSGDPWLELKMKRSEKRPSLHDVATAPPELHTAFGPKLLVGDKDAHVPSVAAAQPRSNKRRKGIHR